MYCPNDDCPDFQKHGVRGEYREGITHCPKCGAPLHTGSPTAKPDLPVTFQQVSGEFAGPLVQVAAFQTEHEADLAVSYLESQGVDAIRASDDCGGAHPGIGFSTRSRVLVPEELAHEAARLLSDATEDRQQDGA